MTEYNDYDKAGWLNVPKDPDLSYNMHYDFKVLGWDREKGEVDFVLRFAADGGHCQRHRHLANTTILVLEGEQHLFDLYPDGRTEHRTRGAGAYHRGTGPEVRPHMERGGDDGALVYYQCQADDGRLFEFVDDDLNVIEEVTVDTLIETWERAQKAELVA
jgi:hypothetical protein